MAVVHIAFSISNTLAADVGVRVVKGIDVTANAANVRIRRGPGSVDPGSLDRVRVYRGGQHPDFQSNREFEPDLGRVLRGLVDARKFEYLPHDTNISVPTSRNETSRKQITRRLVRRAAIKLNRAGFVDKSLIIVHPAGVRGGRNIVVHRAGVNFRPSRIRMALSLDRACPAKGIKVKRRDDGRFCGVIKVHRTGFKKGSRIRHHRAGFR